MISTSPGKNARFDSYQKSTHSYIATTRQDGVVSGGEEPDAWSEGDF